MVSFNVNDLEVPVGNQLGKLHNTLPECSRAPVGMIPHCVLCMFMVMLSFLWVVFPF